MYRRPLNAASDGEASAVCPLIFTFADHEPLYAVHHSSLGDELPAWTMYVLPPKYASAGSRALIWFGIWLSSLQPIEVS